jgi:methylase of polypeptide subunit release factors
VSASSQWQFVGNVPENYERYLVPSIFAPWALDLVEVAALRPRERVLDIACGTGIVARTAARRLSDAATVVGLDLSPHARGCSLGSVSRGGGRRVAGR